MTLIHFFLQKFLDDGLIRAMMLIHSTTSPPQGFKWLHYGTITLGKFWEEQLRNGFGIWLFTSYFLEECWQTFTPKWITFESGDLLTRLEKWGKIQTWAAVEEYRHLRILYRFRTHYVDFCLVWSYHNECFVRMEWPDSFPLGLSLGPFRSFSMSLKTSRTKCKI